MLLEIFKAQLGLPPSPRRDDAMPRSLDGHTWPGRAGVRSLRGDQLQAVIIPILQISTLGPTQVKG